MTEKKILTKPKPGETKDEFKARIKKELGITPSK